MTPLPTAAGGDIIRPGPRIDPEATVAPALCLSVAPGSLPNHSRQPHARWVEWSWVDPEPVESIALVGGWKAFRCCCRCTVKPRKELVQSSPLPPSVLLVGI